MQTGNIILYIACTLDGYIAGENDDLSFLNSVEKPGEDYGYAEFMKNIDSVIMGRRTLDWINKNAPDFSYFDKETYVISHKLTGSSNKKSENAATTGISSSDASDRSGGEANYKYYSGDLKNLADRLLAENKKIFLVGGADIILQMLNFQMIDEFKIAVIPILLGGGIPLFKPGYQAHNLELKDVKQYDTGVVMLHYKLAR